MSVKPSWASIRRSINRGEELTVVSRYPGAYAVTTEAHFFVKRVTNQGMYLRQIHHDGAVTNSFLHWAPASMVEVIDRLRWIVSTNHGKQAWAILPDVPF